MVPGEKKLGWVFFPQKNCFIRSVVQVWDRSMERGGVAPSLVVFKAWLDKATADVLKSW